MCHFSDPSDLMAWWRHQHEVFLCHPHGSTLFHFCDLCGSARLTTSSSDRFIWLDQRWSSIHLQLLSDSMFTKHPLVIMNQSENLGPAWANNTGWLSNGTDPCGWYGVACDISPAVTAIVLNVNFRSFIFHQSSWDEIINHQGYYLSMINLKSNTR
jgi:hypothetical protein